MATGDGEVLGGRKRRQASRGNTLAKRIALEDEEVSFCFVDGKEMHHLPWTELLAVHTETPFESLDDIQVGMNILAPWYDDDQCRIRHAEATVVPSTEGKVEEKKKTSRNKSHTLPKASSPLPKKQNRKKLPTSPKKKVANQSKTTVPSPNQKKLTTSQKTTALPRKVTKKDKDKARTAGNLQSSKHLLALIDCLEDENGNHKLDDNLESDLATSATITQKDSDDKTPQCLPQQPSGSSSSPQGLPLVEPPPLQSLPGASSSPQGLPLVEPPTPQCLQQQPPGPSYYSDSQQYRTMSSPAMRASSHSPSYSTLPPMTRSLSDSYTPQRPYPYRFSPIPMHGSFMSDHSSESCFASEEDMSSISSVSNSAQMRFPPLQSYDVQFVFKHWIHPMQKQLERIEQTLKSNLQPLNQPIDVNLSETELEDEEDLAIDPTGTYLGYTKKSKYRVWVPNLTEVQLRIIESEASDPETLAMKLFQYIFKSELETKADDVCCTKSDGKRLLNQDYLRGIRLHIHKKYQSAKMHSTQEKEYWKEILKKLNGHIRYRRRIHKPKKKCPTKQLP